MNATQCTSVCRILPLVLLPLGAVQLADRFHVEVILQGGGSRRVDVTVENGSQFDLAKRIYGKGNQLSVDADDFPTLAQTGLHSEAELDATRALTAKPVEDINRDAQPGALSTAGFLAAGEDLLNVLKSDNRTVAALGLTHPQLAAPLFHIWNARLAQLEAERTGDGWVFERANYNGREILLRVIPTRGFPDSLFRDEIRGYSDLVIRREPTVAETQFLGTRYGSARAAETLARLSAIHTGETVPYYIMGYGFYEGHTSYRADPVAIAFIFGLRSIEEIEKAFPDKLPELMDSLVPVN